MNTLYVPGECNKIGLKASKTLFPKNVIKFDFPGMFPEN